MADMDSLIVKHVAKRLKIMRKLKNLTLEELALSLGVSRKQLQNYEHCTSAIPIKRLFKLAKYYKLIWLIFLKELKILI
jgi:transcriptional regulator with XRE-family HTH domain